MTQPRHDVSIVIVSYRVPALVERCLDTIAAEMAASRRSLETIVVDNASGDDSVDRIYAHAPWARVLPLELNGGFSTASNIGADEASGRYLLFLNPDTEVQPGAIDRLVDEAERDPSAGVLAPRLDNPDGSLQVSCYAFPSPWRYVIDGTPIPWARPFGRFGAHRYCDPSTDRTRQVEWACGAALLVRRDLFLSLDGFDERFFMYSEDVDLCARAAATGRRVLYVPQARVMHRVNSSEGVFSEALLDRVAKSALLLYQRRSPGRALAWLALGTSLGARIGRLSARAGRRLRPSDSARIDNKLAFQQGLAAAVARARREALALPPAKRTLGLRLKAFFKSQSGTARALDRAARGAAAVAIAGVEHLASLLGRWRGLDEVRGDIRTIVVPGFYGIGDNVMELPALEGVRAAFPAARIRVICSRRLEDLYRAVPAVDEVQPIDERDFYAAARALRRERVDMIVLVHSNLEYYLFARLAGARIRAGYLWDYRAARVSGARARPVPNAARSTVARANRIAELLGAPAGARHPRISVPADACAAADRLLLARGIPPATPIIAVNPNKTGNWLGAGRWPAPRWRALVRHLLQTTDGALVVLGSAPEQPDVARLLAPWHGHPRVVDLSGAASLSTVAALLQRSALLVTTDSGLMHLAGAVGTPAVSLFMFSDVDSFSSGAANQPIYRAVPCSPCVSNGPASRDHYPPICRFDYRCSTAIRVEDLTSAVSGALRADGAQEVSATRRVR